MFIKGVKGHYHWCQLKKKRLNPHPPKKLLDQVSEALRLKHYSIHTEAAYFKRSGCA
jgi:hypothetical protein